MNSGFYSKALPDPFLREDGSRITSPDHWASQAMYIRELAQHHMYGQWPGKVKSIKGDITRKEVCYDGSLVRMREFITLTIDDQWTVNVEIYRPLLPHKVPVIVYNASRHWFRSPIENEVTAAGYAIASFDREMLVPDLSLPQTTQRAKNAFYPTFNCGDIMAWAWGHSLVADYLETCNWVGELICTGHSRGGKAALCAGIMDDRFCIVAPIGSGCGGAGSARFLGTSDGSRQDPTRCETIGKMKSLFPSWMGGHYGDYGTKEEPYPTGDEVCRFPLDAHMLRAACAPRAVFNSEGDTDHWCNLFGTQLCWQASQKVFDFLGVPQRNGFHVRPGGHAFNEADWAALVDFCDMVLGKNPTMVQKKLNKPYFEIQEDDYAPWAK